MPPEGANPSLDERLALRRWIQQGAAWSADANNESILYPHWACQNVISPKPPPPGENWRVQNPIDLFIQYRVEKQGLHLNPPAEQRQRIRRMPLDLTELPPSWDEVGVNQINRISRKQVGEDELEESHPFTVQLNGQRCQKPFQKNLCRNFC
jgi:hypothetical protein